MLSLAAGHDVGYLTGPVAGGREGYYTGAVDSGEPAGLWYGAGAEMLGLRGEVDADLMAAVYSNLLDPRDPATYSRATWATAQALAAPHRKYRSAEEVYAELLEANPGAGPEQRGELRAKAERSARQAVTFIDATFSAPKSVTVLGVAFERAANDARAAGEHEAATAYAAHQRAIEDAVLAGSRAALDYLQDVAGYSRVGHHGGGAGRWIDAHSFVVAQFLQHDSRDRDPQLHVHNAILNRVQCADGTWRTLDSRAIHAFRGAAAAIGERVMEQHLTRSLGVRFATRPDGKAREVLGVSQDVTDLFSTRHRAITAKAEELVAAFRERFTREPSALERTQLAQQATLATRMAKRYNGESLGERLDRWEAETRTKLAGGLAQVAHDVLARGQHIEPAARWSPRDVIERALASVGDSQQSWGRSDLLRHISDALPGHLDVPAERVRDLLDGLADGAEEFAVWLREEESTEHLPADLLLEDGRSAFSKPGGVLFATPGQVAAERKLRQAAVRRGAVTFTADDVAAVTQRYADAACELGADQAAAVRGVMTSGARIETLSAAAGTGKSFVVGAINHAWRGAQRHAFGLASSQVATQVLAEEGLDALNVTRWLDTQRRLDKTAGSSSDDQWRLQSGDLVVVDEAGMADTASLVEIHRRCDAAGAKLLLVGDPRQLTAVGAGGTLTDVSEHGVGYELTEVRRFRATWEASASLRLRDGDVSVLDEYVKHGRIVDAGTADQAEAAAARAWLADTLAGRDTVALVSTNAAAGRMSDALRAELVLLGHVEETGVALSREGTVAGVGDLVQARRNGWHLIGYEGNVSAPINRRCYRVRETRPDGGLVVADVDRGETLTLSAEYVAEHVTLGYASTVHAAQGRTVDTAHTVIDKATDAAGAYVGLTRGRDRNTAYCVTVAVADNAAPGEATTVEERTGRAVLADVIGRDEHDKVQADTSALAQAKLAEEAARSTKVSIDRLAEDVAKITAARTSAILDRLVTDGVLSPVYRTELAADQALGSVQQLLRTAELAGHDIATVLTDALEGRPLDGSRSPAQVLHRRISKDLMDELTPQVTSYADLVPEDAPAERRPWLQILADGADQRRWELGARVAEDRPQWALETLGPVPEDVVGREEWESRAGWAAAYRELVDHGDTADAIGSAPAAGLAEKHAAWRAAHAALQLSEPGTAEAGMTEGRLRIRVRAYERETEWAPRWVGDELAATHTSADRIRAEAEVSRARAEVAEDDAERQRLCDVAHEAARRAQELAARAVALETADYARGAWYAATAGTREAADRARAQLGARGVTLDDPNEQVTAQEWLAEHRAVQVADETDRPVRDEAELHDPMREADQVADDQVAEDERVLDTEVPDIRETSTRDITEATDAADRHRIPSADETAAAVARAQAALAEIEARRRADEARAADDAARCEQLNRWAENDRAAEQATEAARDDELVLEA